MLALILLLATTAPLVDTPEAAAAALGRGELSRADQICRAWLGAHPGDGQTLLLHGQIQFFMAQAMERAGKPRREYLPVYRRARESLVGGEKLGARNSAIPPNTAPPRDIEKPRRCASPTKAVSATSRNPILIVGRVVNMAAAGPRIASQARQSRSGGELIKAAGPSVC